jgi:hypothetical protein
MTICVVCGFPVPDEYGDRLTCGDHCLTELKNRKEVAKLHRKEANQLKRTNYQPMEDTIQMIVEHFARILLEQDIPMYISNKDVDQEICKRDIFINKLNKVYRKRCANAGIVSCGYIAHSTANHGKKIYRRAEDRDVLRAKLTNIVGVIE